MKLLFLLLTTVCFALGSYQVKLSLTFPDGTKTSDTVLVLGEDWTEKKIANHLVRLKVKSLGTSKVQTTVEITAPGSDKPLSNQFITHLNDRTPASVKGNEDTKAYEIKLAVKANVVSDEE